MSGALTEKQIATARLMRKRGMSDTIICNRLCIERSTLKSALDPAWRQRRNEKARAAKARRQHAVLRGCLDQIRAPQTPRRPKYDPHVDGPPVYAGAFDELMGDPPVGRRALDLR